MEVRRRILLLLWLSLLGCCKDPPPGSPPGPPAGRAARESGNAKTSPSHPPLGRASRFGIDYAFPLTPEHRQDVWPRVLSASRAGWIDFADVRWDRIEPDPPSEKGHDYRWNDLDQAVRVWQRHGFHIVLSLRLGRGWFAGPIRYRPASRTPIVALYVRSSDRLPEARHIASYGAWISALVERYDGDGVDDMPGLTSPIRHLQVGNEYANPMFWSGTLKDYATLFSLTVTAARRASPKVRIISNGIRWNDLFHGDPTASHFEQRFDAFLARLPSDGWRADWKRARRFTEGTLALAPGFDILDAGGNGPYPTMSEGYMAWVRTVLSGTASRPRIWDMEARSEPMLVADPKTTFHLDLRVPGGDEILRVLKNKRHRDHARFSAWYRAEQARVLTKVFVTRFAAGFEKVFMGMPGDWDGTLAALSTPNPFLGLLDRSARPWPAFSALCLLVDELDGFEHAERLEAPKGISLFHFTFHDASREVWVTWRDQARPGGPDHPLPQQRVSFAAIPAPALARPIPTVRNAEPAKPVRTGDPVTLDVGPTPLLIERATKSTVPR